MLYYNFNNSPLSKVFPNNQKKADITPVLKKEKKKKKIITDLFAFRQVSQKSMNVVYTIK